MKKKYRWPIYSGIVGVLIFLCYTIGWADVLFWKTGTIARTLKIPISILLFPIDVLPISPGSLLDIPYFFIPLVIILISMWGYVIAYIEDKFIQKSNSN